MAHLSSGKSFEPPSPQKAHLLVELEETKRILVQMEKKMRQLVERMIRLEDTQEMQNRERRWELISAKFQ